MGILSKLSLEKNTYFNKPKTHHTNLSENSSCSLTESEFLLTGSHSSNSSNETTGIPMNKANNGAPRRVKNLPIALTPNIGGEKYNFPTSTASNKGSTPRGNGRLSTERKPPPPPEKEPRQLPKTQRHPYTAHIRNLSQDAYSKLPQPDQANTAYFKPKNEQYSNNQANSQQVNQASSHELPIVHHQGQGQHQQMEMHSPLRNEQVYSESRQPYRTEEHYFQAQRAMNSVPTTTDRSPKHDNVIQTPQNMQNTPSKPLYYHEQRSAVEESEEDSDEYTEEDSDTDSEEYTDTSDESVNNSNTNASYTNQYANVPQQHPYYEQWMQYYASLAAHQQQQQQQQQMMPNRSSMYGYNHPYQINPLQYSSMNSSDLRTSSTPEGKLSPYSNDSNHSRQHSHNSQETNSNDSKNDYLTHYKKRSGQNSIDDSNNELVSNSRRSTIKSNRYPSVPLSILESHSKIPEKSKARVSSLDLNFKPKEYHKYDDDNEDKKDEINESHDEGASVQKQYQDSTTSIAFGLLNMALDNQNDERHISDYSKFLFEGDSQAEEEEEEEEEDYKESADVNKSKNNQFRVNESKHELSRHESIESNDSVGSIQRESNNFKVKEPTSSNTQSVRDSDLRENNKQKKERRREKHGRKSSSVNPDLSITSQADLFHANNTADACQLQPTTMPYLRHSQMPSMESMPFNQNGIPFNQPMMAYNTEYQGIAPPMDHSRRQSIATAESKRQSMMFSTGNVMPPYGALPVHNNRMSMPVISMNTSNKLVQIQTTDSKIKKKVEEFVELRKVIASGNKSLEYRLKWVKMLINATNYRLYAFVNIKGEPILQELSKHSKALFLKSSINHLLKLVKEYDVRKKNENIHSQVCYIYGCLLKHDYAASYNQDFGIEKDIQESISYFEKSLELNPNNFQSLYKLGEIFEYEFPDQFDQALSKYKEAAKLGYNRAIYKMALLYLNVPLIRSTKFFNYLVELSNIDLNSKDVELTGEDRDELEEIIGLAFYQLGKIYEGIYPGDLHAEDEFISKSLERAPVNYAKGLTYYNKSAKLDCLLAQIKLGSVYENGELNRQQNPSKSIQWYMKAVSSPLLFKRHPDAMLGLSRWNLKGSNGLSKYIPSPDPEKAVMWCDRAIKEFNSPEAYFAMANLNEIGLGDRNPQLWYFKAHELGHQEASSKLGYA
ncbi:uncharacterized protein AC631_00461 [Debaryomyces fabryi]|uniref:Uncharacterized protein n=1 Tax=Debaryomyces fabryi TaxID=58627 RepID=A0A0V1Q5S3_9ASCO|nr:uncharacterized protein AC631_00461 [Debaryomyces fabryi]KSA03826.1 hypothetical protein AC631_00461 [Debaryomyces fabryi]CUM45346.1 unnamed protein product [Debaryomyces fabryi]